MTTFEILEHEHEVILLVLDAVEREAARTRSDGTHETRHRLAYERADV